MTNFIALCLGLITLELGVVVAFLVLTLVRVQRTAEAVEILAYRIDEQVDAVGRTVRSGWGSALGAAASFAGGWFSGRRRD